MKLLLAIAFGGAVGALGRHFVIAKVAALTGHGFPFGTLAANVIGSFVMGVLVELMALAWSPSAELRAFLTVGVLGAFTTFSAFSLDVALLVERGQDFNAALYVAASVCLSVGGLFAGMYLFRHVLS
ncbi:MAG: fluoride efflux transporter CrcB [Rhodovibrionaceae bacterium]|nr:fluoride efflux transporter CrcB [Rhodovibrionaceae bacterium]